MALFYNMMKHRIDERGVERLSAGPGGVCLLQPGCLETCPCMVLEEPKVYCGMGLHYAVYVSVRIYECMCVCVCA